MTTSMQIPIRFQGDQYESSRQPQWLQSQQQPQESAWKQSVSQQPQQGFQQPQQGFQQPQQGIQESWKSGVSQQVPQQGQEFQKPSWFGTQQQQQGYQQGQQFQQQPYSMFQQGQVQLVQKTIQQNDVGVTDLTTLHLILRLAGVCYVKEHVLLKLCNDNMGIIRKWHNDVTIKNLDVFSMIAKNWGLTLPFPESLEKREQDIKSQLSNVSNVITIGEAYSDLCFSAQLLQQELSCAFMTGTNHEFKEACKTASCTLCESYTNLKHAIKNTDQYFPPPLVKQVLVHEGVQSRR